MRQFAYGFKNMEDLRVKFCEKDVEPMKTIFKGNMGKVGDLLGAWDVARNLLNKEMDRV